MRGGTGGALLGWAGRTGGALLARAGGTEGALVGRAGRRLAVGREEGRRREMWGEGGKGRC